MQRKCLTEPVLRSVVVFLLFALSCGKRRCNYTEILGSYRGIILVELQHLNLTGSFKTSKQRDPCSSGKEIHLLRSIYNMTQQFRCLRGSQPQEDMGKPVETMVQVISEHCQYLVGKEVSKCPNNRIPRNRKKRAKLANIMKTLVKCWQKLQSIHADKT